MSGAKVFFTEFKEFACRGNVVDMAVGVVIGAAFKAIVDSLVNDVVMPFVGIFVDTGSLSEISLKIGNAEIMIGKFIAAAVSFLIIAFVIFCVVKAINKAHEAAAPKKEETKEPEPAPAPTAEELLSDILTELRGQNK